MEQPEIERARSGTIKGNDLDNVFEQSEDVNRLRANTGLKNNSLLAPPRRSTVTRKYQIAHVILDSRMSSALEQPNDIFDLLGSNEESIAKPKQKENQNVDMSLDLLDIDFTKDTLPQPKKKEEPKSANLGGSSATNDILSLYNLAPEEVSYTL